MTKKEKRLLTEEYKKRLYFLLDDIESDLFEEEGLRTQIEKIAIGTSERETLLFGDDRKAIISKKGINTRTDGDILIHEICKADADSEKKRKKKSIIMFFESIHEKNIMEGLIREKKQDICKELGGKSKDVAIFVLFVPKADGRALEINISRMNSLIFPEPTLNLNVFKRIDTEGNSEKDVKGYLFAVKLADIVKLYDTVGDELFASNLRYGINDGLGLENSMRNTLLKEPDMFWFYNNGITIITKNKEIALNHPTKIILSESWKNRKLDFSVINGAQTISTASRIFGDDSLDSTKKKDAKDKAMVLLRIIVTKDNSIKRNVTISLNRQKPIKYDDIAFQSIFVSSFNEYMLERRDNHEKYFIITKRGEEVYDYNTIELSTFAQLIYACFMNPTAARNPGSAKLYYENGDGEKLNGKYFIEDFLSDSNTRDVVFDKYYQELMWAYSLYKSYKRKIWNSENTDIRTILSNNKWLFVAYVLKIICNFTGNECEIDYSMFRECDDVAINIEDYMRAFAETVNTVSDNNYTPNNSKSKKLWEDLCKAEIPDIFKKLVDNSQENMTDSNTIHDFKQKLIDAGFCARDDSEDEYEKEVDCTNFGILYITIDSEKLKYDISVDLFNPYYANENLSDDEGNDLYNNMINDVREKFISQFGEKPDIEEYIGCPDPTVAIEYKDRDFDIDFVKRFISVMCDYEI